MFLGKQTSLYWPMCHGKVVAISDKPVLVKWWMMGYMKVLLRVCVREVVISLSIVDMAHYLSAWVSCGHPWVWIWQQLSSHRPQTWAPPSIPSAGASPLNLYISPTVHISCQRQDKTNINIRYIFDLSINYKPKGNSLKLISSIIWLKYKLMI